MARYHAQKAAPEAGAVITDTLESIAREGARAMLARALDEEVDEFLGRPRYAKGGRRTGYRNGHGREREVGEVLLFMRRSRRTLLTNFRVEAMTGDAWRTLSKVASATAKEPKPGEDMRYSKDAASFGMHRTVLDKPLKTRRVRITINAPGIARLHEIEVLPPSPPAPPAPRARAVPPARPGFVDRQTYSDSSRRSARTSVRRPRARGQPLPPAAACPPRWP